MQAAAAELFARIGQLAGNPGATDEHRALNYLAVRSPAIYAHAAQKYAADAALTSVLRPLTAAAGARGQRNTLGRSGPELVAAEDGGQCFERVGAQGVIGPYPALVAGEDTGVHQDLEVVGDGGLGQAEGFGQVADAGFAAVVGGDHGDQAEPGGVGQGFERPRQVGGLTRGERLPHQRRAAFIGEREGWPAFEGDGSVHLTSMPKTLTGVYFSGHSRHRQSSM